LTDSILTQDANPGGAVVTVGGRMRVTGELDVDAGLKDSAGSTGLTGQLLSSTGGAATLWVNPSAGATAVFPFVAGNVAPFIITINHTGAQGSFPSVTVVDGNNIVVIGEVTYITTTQLTLTFTATFSGTAYLN